MNTVRPQFTAASSARSLRRLMRQQGITPSTLAWILNCSLWRALQLSLGSQDWTLTEVHLLVSACAPEYASVPGWGVMAKAAA